MAQEIAKKRLWGVVEVSVQCRNCGSTDRYEKEVEARGGYGPDLLPLKRFSFGSLKYRLEVCGACGLTEWFVPEQHLALLKEVFTKMP